VHHHEYSTGRTGRVLDALWVVVWSVVVGLLLGSVVLVFGMAALETGRVISADLDSTVRATFGVAVLSTLAVLLVALLVSAVRSVLYAERLAVLSADPAAQLRPPTPAQRGAARGTVAETETTPFVSLWVFALVLVLVGAFLMVFMAVERGAGWGGAVVGGGLAVVLGVVVNRLVALLRRRLAGARSSWPQSPSDPGNGDQRIVPVALSATYRGVVWLDRTLRVVGTVVGVAFAATAIVTLGPGAGNPALLPLVLDRDRPESAPAMLIITFSTLVMVSLFIVSIVLEVVRRGLLLGVLGRVAEDEASEGDGVATTRPDPRLTWEALGHRSPVRRAAQLLAGSGAFVLVLAAPLAVVVAEQLGDAAQVDVVTVVAPSAAAAALLIAVVAELLTAGRDRRRRNRLLRAWPRALAPAEEGDAQ
jgi:hypothetical protein